MSKKKPIKPKRPTKRKRPAGDPPRPRFTDTIIAKG